MYLHSFKALIHVFKLLSEIETNEIDVVLSFSKFNLFSSEVITVLGVGLKFNLTTEYGGPFNRRVSFYIDTIRLDLSEYGLNYSRHYCSYFERFYFC